MLVKAGDEGGNGGSSSGLGVFDGVVPVPMQLPGLPLAKEGDKAPWFLRNNF